MFKLIRLINQINGIIVLKKINNIIFISLNSSINIYSDTKIIKIIKNFFTYSFLLYFIRIVWRGKAYRIRFFKKKLKFTFNFGHSHWYKIIYNKKYCNFFKIKRQNYLLFYKNRKDFFLYRDTFNSIRHYNKYTRRGIRVKKIFFLKRFGKISQVNSILHSF